MKLVLIRKLHSWLHYTWCNFVCITLNFFQYLFIYIKLKINSEKMKIPNDFKSENIAVNIVEHICTMYGENYINERIA